MIVLDTNVVSEPLKPQPEQAVLDWLDEQAPETLYLSTVSAAELLAGIEVMPAGRRRTRLSKALADRMMPLFEGRVLGFDLKAAEAFAASTPAPRQSATPSVLPAVPLRPLPPPGASWWPHATSGISEAPAWWS